MTRNYFSKRGGPYFISDGFSKHNEGASTIPYSVIDKIKSFFKSRRRNQK
jgi:hypothetical protein